MLREVSLEPSLVVGDGLACSARQWSEMQSSRLTVFENVTADLLVLCGRRRCRRHRYSTAPTLFESYATRTLCKPWWCIKME